MTWTKTLKDYGLAVGGSALLALLVRVYVIEAYRVPSSAMRPTLEAGDTLFALKWRYGPFGNLQPYHGDVVVYQSSDPNAEVLVKRVVALSGDRVALKDGLLQLNGKPLSFRAGESADCGSESHPSAQYSICLEQPLPGFDEVKVPEGAVYVLSDLRQEAATRRRLGELIRLDQIRAQAKWIWISVDPNPSTARVGWFPPIRAERFLKTIK